jgi:gamma-glutamyl:cysteine ligase YbdK (ATP-grasp superfamily)
MGQEIGITQFTETDHARFLEKLQTETELLAELIRRGELSSRGPLTGFELEGWLVYPDMSPAPLNEAFLERYNDPASSAELARYNVEFNSPVLPLATTVLTDLKQELGDIQARARVVANSLGVELLLIGSLPTLREPHLSLSNLSDLNRYRLLNDRILASRRGQAIPLNIVGRQHLVALHEDVMPEAAATSFQLHWQIPLEDACRYYNAALIASAPVVAIAANSPFVFGTDLWAETRIALFEQAIPVGSYQDGLHGPLHRVSFGTGFARASIAEVFIENLEHFPVLLAYVSPTDPARFTHLKLHNGTIWRWNRPLVGADEDGTPHIRLEHRPLPAGPTIPDMVANAALFYGLVESLASDIDSPKLDFAQTRDNFYLAARHGLGARLIWQGKHLTAARLLADRLLPKAREGLEHLGLGADDIGHYLGIIEARNFNGQTGCEWQRRYISKHPGAFADMTSRYLEHQQSGKPVHEWSV